MIQFINPFNQQDPDRYAIWEMLVKRDIEAFIDNDWDAVANDFVEDGFMGIDARSSGSSGSSRQQASPGPTGRMTPRRNFMRLPP